MTVLQSEIFLIVFFYTLIAGIRKERKKYQLFSVSAILMRLFKKTRSYVLSAQKHGEITSSETSVYEFLLNIFG